MGGTLGINETNYYKKYLTLTSSSSNHLIPESTGFKIESPGTNTIIASVDGINNKLGEATATIHSSQETKIEDLTINFNSMFDIESYNLNGIEELKGFDINYLDLSNNKLTTLSALEGLTINDLNVSHNDIISIIPLTKVLELQSLNISYNKITSIKALSNIRGLTNIISNNN